MRVPAAIWGVLIEFGGWVCPLTPRENYLRERGGALGVCAFAINVPVYTRARRKPPAADNPANASHK